MTKEQSASNRVEVKHVHDVARKMAIRDLIDLNKTVFDMLYRAHLNELKDEVGWVDKRLSANRIHPHKSGQYGPASDKTEA